MIAYTNLRHAVFPGAIMSTVTATHRPAPLIALRWIARLLSLGSIALLAMFAYGPQERAMPTPSEWLLIAFFPIGVALGMAIAWWREITGGLISLVSLAIFYATMLANTGHVRGPYFLIFTAPALMFLACGLLARRQPDRAA